jgi:hypothetical protein
MIIRTKNSIEQRIRREADERRKSRKEKGSVDRQVKFEAYKRKDLRRQLDTISGLRRTSDPQRGDFKQCREADKVIKDYCKFKDPKDREKIKREYMEAQGRRGY